MQFLDSLRLGRRAEGMRCCQHAQVRERCCQSYVQNQSDWQ